MYVNTYPSFGNKAIFLEVWAEMQMQIHTNANTPEFVDCSSAWVLIKKQLDSGRPILTVAGLCGNLKTNSTNPV